VREHFPIDRDAAVLDVGGGHGALIHFAREAGYRNLRSVDRSPEQVAAAQRLGIEGVEEGDLGQVLRAQADASLDVVVAFDVIEHFTRDKLLPFVDQVHRVLKPGGRWIIHVPNGASPFFGAIRYGDLTHELAFTRTSLSQLLLSSASAAYAASRRL
jgi:cyclopropane fatty-acyl-phospholipid synthase-like methyltransferase